MGRDRWMNRRRSLGRNAYPGGRIYTVARGVKLATMVVGVGTL